MQPPSFTHSFGEPCRVEPGAAQGPHQASKMPLLVPAIGTVTGGIPGGFELSCWANVPL